MEEALIEMYLAGVSVRDRLIGELIGGDDTNRHRACCALARNAPRLDRRYPRPIAEMNPPACAEFIIGANTC